MQSKFLPYFEKAVSHIKLVGNRLLVEILPAEEIKTSGGIILATREGDYKSSTEENRAVIALVVAVGTHHYDLQTGSMELGPGHSVGQILWITRNPIYISHFPGIGSTEQKLAFITDDQNDIHASWENWEAYEAYKKAVQL